VAKAKVLSRRSVVREYLHGAVWVLPALGIIVGLVGGALVSVVRVAPGSLLDKLIFHGTADDARQVLTVVSATMITTTGIVFSLTVLSLQIASSQFSVRLLRTFLRDVSNQAVLAIFVCTFAYSTGGLYTVGEHRDGQLFVPELAVSGSLVLVFVSTGALVFFLHHLMHSIQIDTIVQKVQQLTLGLVDELFPDPDTPDATRVPPPARPTGAVVLLSPRSGYLQAVDVDALTEDVAASGYAVQLVTSVGDYVTAGSILGWYWDRRTQRRSAGAADPQVPRRFMHHVHIGFERTLQQDIRFGLRQLVDVALRALSPAINDPYTAIQIVHRLSAIEVVLAARAMPDDVRRDGTGEVLVWLPYPGFAVYLTVACTQIRRSARQEPLVLAALLQMLSAVAASCVNAERRAAVQAQIDLVASVSQRHLTEPSDRAMVAGAAAQARAVAEHPGTLAPPPSAFGMVAAAAACEVTTGSNLVDTDGAYHDSANARPIESDASTDDRHT
jgi:uncharacterized membrane protein